jgi:bifunctional non-homologous end joining protein LigD
MLASPWRAPFIDPGWIFEVKWDGVRVMLGWNGSVVSARSRRGNDLVGAFPELTSFRWPREGVIDGEIVALSDTGRPSFELLQQRIHARGSRAEALARSIRISVVAFDVVHDGGPIVESPLEERIARLAQLESVLVTRAEPTRADGVALFEAIQSSKMEGIVAKRLGSLYRQGARSPDWRKISVVSCLRGVIGGYVPGDGRRARTFGSLLLGLFDGESLRFIGRVGTGFDDRTLVAIRGALEELASDFSPFAPTEEVGEAMWVHPGLVARVAYKNWTASSRLRAPVFEGLDLVDPDAVTWQAEGPGSQSPVE